jgi:hypothetical protein
MPKLKSTDEEQEYLECQIMKYQKAIEDQQFTYADEIYDKICKIYKPGQFISTWQRQYLYLYDSPEDFTQDYMRVFIQTLRKWKPKESRGVSRYNGTGSFKNYFWGSLTHNYVNLIKSVEGAAKRNTTMRCPECNEWHNPLSTHIIKCHPNLLWDKLRKTGVNVNELTTCPFCKNNIYRGKSELPYNELIQKHILSKHLHMLFEAFNDKYPSVHSGSVKHTGIDIAPENEDSFTVYDVTPAPSSLLDKIMSSNLTPIQQLIIENIISKKNPVVKYSKKEYNCSEGDFNNAMDELQDKIVLMEDMIGKY